jgi:hypothetical protein
LPKSPEVPSSPESEKQNLPGSNWQLARPKPNRLMTLIKWIFTDRDRLQSKENVPGSVCDRTKRIVVIPEEPGETLD